MEESQTVEDPQAKTLDEVRGYLRQAADIKDPRQMWYAVRDILNLLTLMIVPEPMAITPETLPGGP